MPHHHAHSRPVDAGLRQRTARTRCARHHGVRYTHTDNALTEKQGGVQFFKTWTDEAVLAAGYHRPRTGIRTWCANRMAHSAPTGWRTVRQ